MDTFSELSLQKEDLTIASGQWFSTLCKFPALTLSLHCDPVLTHWLTSECRGPHLQDLMLHDVRWSWCNTNRNKVHSKCNAFESSPNHPLTPVHGKIVFHETGSWCKMVGARSRNCRKLIRAEGLDCCLSPNTLPFSSVRICYLYITWNSTMEGTRRWPLVISLSPTPPRQVHPSIRKSNLKWRFQDSSRVGHFHTLTPFSLLPPEKSEMNATSSPKCEIENLNTNIHVRSQH